MLEQQVKRPRRGYGLGVVVLALVSGAALPAWTRLWSPAAPTVIVTPTVLPPAQVSVEVPECTAPPVEPAAEPAADDGSARPAPVVGTTCAEDTATIGLPIDDSDGRAAQEILGVRTSRLGCTIAAWTQTRLYVSWDGGQTFAQPAITGAFDVAVTSGRVAIVNDRHELGVMRAGEAAITWHPITALAERAPRGDDSQAGFQIVADGAWSAIAVARLILATDDDGQTWRYLTPATDGAQLREIDADGRLTAIVVAPVREPTEEEAGMGAPVESETRRFETRIIGGSWRRLATLPGYAMAASRSWSYSLQQDQFWGCGSSRKLVASHGGRQVTLAEGLRDENYHISVAANAELAFAGLSGKLHRLVGARDAEVADMPGDDPRVVAVTADGSPLAIGAWGLVRWSARGGWRRLLVAR